MLNETFSVIFKHCAGKERIDKKETPFYFQSYQRPLLIEEEVEKEKVSGN